MTRARPAYTDEHGDANRGPTGSGVTCFTSKTFLPGEKEEAWGLFGNYSSLLLIDLRRRIRFAATLGAKTNLKKLSKKDVNSVDIRQAWFFHALCIVVISPSNYILSPPEPLALRLSSNLLLGVLRIYQQQCQIFESSCLSSVELMWNGENR